MGTSEGHPPKQPAISLLGFLRRDAILPGKMCTPKKLLHRQEALIQAIKQDQPMKIKTPTHHQCCDDARREAQEIVEEICSHSPKVEVDETR
jgi:hypothetical protein